MTHNKNKCPVCGVPWTAHLGIAGTCKALAVAMEQVRMLQERMADSREVARKLETELAHYRAALDQQISVTLGQMKTIRELRAQP